jgi:hypothetical protein
MASPHPEGLAVPAPAATVPTEVRTRIMVGADLQTRGSVLRNTRDTSKHRRAYRGDQGLNMGGVLDLGPLS